ncbi:hypothetical protein Tco_1500898, partial [Tanacetum coccineum]
IEFSNPLKEETYQVTLDALKLSLCYPAFQITAEVPEIYMHQFWNTIKKIGKTYAYEFKLGKKKCRVDTEVFREILQICSRLPNQDFVELPSEDVLLSFIKELGYSGNCEMLSTIRTDLMDQPWRTFAATLCIKMTTEKLVQQEKRTWPTQDSPKSLLIISSPKDNSISMRNKINLHTTHDDGLLGALKFVSKTEDYQKYGALIPDGMINDDVKLSTAYKTYLKYATGKVPPKKARKFKKPASPKLKIVPASPKEPTQKGKRLKRPVKKATTVPSTGVVIKDTPAKSVSKKIAPAKTDRGKGIELLCDVPDEQIGKTKDISEGTGVILGVLDVSKEDSSDSDDDSWGNSKQRVSALETKMSEFNQTSQFAKVVSSISGIVDMYFAPKDDDENPSFTLKDYEEEGQDEEYVFSPEKDKYDDEEKMYEEEDDDVTKELYGDLNITQGLKDTDMTNAEQGREDLQNASHEFGLAYTRQKRDEGHM